MSTQVCCDGCKEILRAEYDVALTGQRDGITRGGGLPDGEFHLCYPCSLVAFHALATRPAGRVNMDRLATEIQDARRSKVVTS